MLLVQETEVTTELKRLRMLLHTLTSHSCFLPAHLQDEGSPAPLWPHLRLQVFAVQRGATLSRYLAAGHTGARVGIQRQLLGRDVVE